MAKMNPDLVLGVMEPRKFHYALAVALGSLPGGAQSEQVKEDRVIAQAGERSLRVVTA